MPVIRSGTGLIHQSRRFLTARMRMIRTLLIVIVLILIAIEVVLRLAGYVYVRHVLASNVAGSSSDITILCLGESTTVGLWVNWDESYPKQMEGLLRNHYQTEDLHAIVPVHIGQNSSQIANRIKQYLDTYNPKLVIMMMGANNVWSLQESHAIYFVDTYSKRTLLFAGLILLNEFRTFKLARYLYLRSTTKGTADYWGPHGTRWPPKNWTYGVADHNPNAFKEMWGYDANLVIDESQKRGISVLMMTYPIHPRSYVPIELMGKVASERGVFLVRNDESFTELSNEGVLDQYLMHDKWHPNGAGYRIVAENAFKVIVEKSLLKTGRADGHAGVTYSAPLEVESIRRR